MVQKLDRYLPSLWLTIQMPLSFDPGEGSEWMICSTPFSTRNAAQIGRNHREVNPTVKMGMRPHKSQKVDQTVGYTFTAYKTVGLEICGPGTVDQVAKLILLSLK